MGIHYYTLPQSDIERSHNCMFLSSCLDTPLLVSRRELSCYGIRMCDVTVDISNLEIILWQATQAIRIMKRQLDAVRYLGIVETDPAPLVYAKAYEVGFS